MESIIGVALMVVIAGFGLGVVGKSIADNDYYSAKAGPVEAAFTKLAIVCGVLMVPLALTAIITLS
jgi:hypothetical protein